MKIFRLVGYLICLFTVMAGIVLSCLAPAHAGKRSVTNLCTRVSRGVVGVVTTTLTPDALSQPVPPAGMGSGFIMDGVGHVVTVTNIISDPHAVEVILFNGHRWPAKLVGTDFETGVAVLKIQAPRGELSSLTPMTMGTVDTLKLGQKVLALASPFTAGFVVAQGIISAIRPTVLTPAGYAVDMVIQTNIPVQKSWSGGPLIDLSGRVMGMNTSVFLPGGPVPGLGFAISSDTVTWIVAQIISRGRVERPWLGATLQTVTPTLSRLLGLPVDYGAMITKLARKGPGARAGLRAANRKVCLGNQICFAGGDIIVEVNGKKVKSDSDVLSLLRQMSPGDTVMLTIYRDEKLARISVQLSRRPFKRQILK